MSVIKKQNSSAWVHVGPFVAATDALTPLTGLSLTPYISKNGAAMSTRDEATAVAHDRDGYYRVKLNSTDLNTAGHVRVQCSATATAIAAYTDVMVMSSARYEAMYGTGALISVLSTAGLDNALIESTITAAGAMRVILAQVAGPTSGAGTTTVKFMDQAKSKDRITMALNSSGNRDTITLDTSS